MARASRIVKGLAWSVLALSAGGFAAWAAGRYLVQFHGFPEVHGAATMEDSEVWGQFGDYIGGILNPVLAFMSLLILIVTIQTQAADLRQASKQTRLQNFEGFFFQILGSYLDSIRDIRAEPDIGRDAIRRYVLSVEKYLIDYSLPHDPDIYDKAYMEFWNTGASVDLGHTMRLLYNLVKYVDRSEDLSGEQKKFYADIVRAHLSVPEQMMLMFNALGPFGRRKFKLLIENYGLLEGIPKDSFRVAEYRQDFAASAFGDR